MTNKELSKCQVCKKKAKLTCVAETGKRGIKIFMVCESCAKLFNQEDAKNGQQK
jgi:protein-arginine kinase activator protein McsA